MPRRTKYQGIPIYIEYEKGEEKPSKDGGDTAGFYQHAPYGYIENTISNEVGEELDVFLGPEKESREVFLCTLMDPQDTDSFMEYKVLLGFKDAQAAENFIKEQYYTDMIGPVIGMSLNELKDWIELMAPAAAKDKEREEPALTVKITEPPRAETETTSS